VQALREAGWTFRHISERTKIPLVTVYTICKTPATLKKRSGRPQILDAASRQWLVNYIQQSSITCWMPFMEVAAHCGMK